MIDQTIIVAIIAAISSSGVSSIILYMLQRRDKQSDTEKLKTQMLLGLANECIVRRASEYMDRGWIEWDEKKELIKYLYEPYKALGGDGSIEQLMEDVMKLETRSRKRARQEASPE